MSNVRATIEILLKILRENGALKLKAEIFRLGKFNQDEAVEPLWHLLFELVYYCKFGSIEDISVRAWMEMKKEEIVVYVKHEMHNLGFFSADLAALPLDMSTGSRELLLALGWLMCKENIMHRFMMSCTSPVDHNDTSVLYRNVKADFTAPKFSGDIVERVKQLLWFNNKLQMNLRTLFAVQNEKSKLKHKMHEATYGNKQNPDRSHLTMFEVHLLRHPDLLQKNIELLENDNERLQNLLRWTECEDVFWKWMESVLDEKQKDKSQSESAHVTVTSDDVMSIPRYTVNRLQQSHDDLQGAIIKYETIVDNLERLWESKAVDVTEEELDSVLSAIDLELSIQKANIQLSNCEQCLTSPPEPVFIYEKKRAVKKPTSVSIGYTLSPTSTQSTQNTVADIQDEIHTLESEVNQLQHQLDYKQDCFREELEQLSTQFSDVVCIPPMSRNAINV